MNRRTFLGALMGLAATPLLERMDVPTIEYPIDVVTEPIIMPTVEARGIGRLLQIDALNPATHWTAPIGLRILFPNGSLLLDRYLGPGMEFLWAFRAATEPIFTERDPLVLDFPPHLHVRMVYSVDGEIHQRRVWGHNVRSDVIVTHKTLP